MANKEYYKCEIDQVIVDIGSDGQVGLTSKEVETRLEEYGKNVLEGGKKVSPWHILLEKLNNIIVYLLLAAAAISFALGDTVEGIAVLIAVFIAVAFGFVSELKAQKSVESLQSMIKTKADVVRDGQLMEINSEDLVPGDLLSLKSGDAISADARLIESTNLACMEASLTGESIASSKDASLTFDEDVSLGDRKNYVFAGTAVTRGNAKAIVTATGSYSEVGQISSLLKETKKEASPLNQELDKLGRLLIGIAALFALIVIVIGLATGRELSFVLQVALILAIASIPEAMPAVSTITLAKGMSRMSEHKALVKTLDAVETLGSTSVICSDKTGTLTENQMTVESIYLLNGQEYEVTGGGYEPTGQILHDGTAITVDSVEKLQQFLYAAVLNTNATLQEEHGEYSIIGDPTEGSLIVLGDKVGYSRNRLHDEGFERLDEIPFNSKLKYMITLYQKGDQKYTFIKGGPDVLLDMSHHDQDTKAKIREKNEEMASHGWRVLAIGMLDDNEAIYNNTCDGNVRILGLVGIIDPPRKDVMESIRLCQRAGIRVKMITGDHPQTASVIAKQIGMRSYDNVMTGFEFDNSKHTQKFDHDVCRTGVFARVSPRNKLDIVKILQETNEVVAMTGDGVNDAPALNGADIGIAMGVRGTEVAREAADMILTTDKFSTIVDAVKEGRIIFANIRKFVYYLFSCNMVEITSIILSLLFLIPDLPVLPLHILWLNLVVDILPAMSLGFEPAEDNIMDQPPRKKGQGLLSASFLKPILLSGLVLGFTAFGIYAFSLHRGFSVIEAQTTTFTLMAIMQLLHILNVRRVKVFGLDKTLLQNKSMIIAMLVAVGLQLVAIYVPLFNDVLGTVPLGVENWMYILTFSIAATIIVYVLKRVFKMK
ncbi:MULTISPECIES: HAD-IC family P-type ATPase [unclassified Breznakia]|uniref:cation-translocating P-type ATPase n=1 Tax=unclassified Breznakia TaxID=2623764 RepID=UPI00247613D1|nr:MULTISPECIES: HAD-IC family P-type ATPase [unclassified Breznakia]MDH6365961.1 Ca2+-transporting ATPase [Breznakia sp. PH1-1]MDH6403107.1 Ca2+-transporting ATPase [Breznakia sp. PF1-11]MDH6410816.1 Ca2+-transporting ATPase [Breznakia sp. PFB1-11]MDH6413127.1 Ca2+-transporting ATPase [Breznakia sp. PFB1-14]MDH6415495.1 Ca2+-transporting ATPase [Breznakia sp. PFB1-4]